MATATGATEFLSVGSAGQDVDAFVPELWAGPAIVERENNLVFARLVNRQFESELTFGDTIHVGSITNFNARQKSQEGVILFESQDEANTDITIDQWYYSAVAIESMPKVQVNRDMLEAYSGKLGYALALNVDDALAGLPDDLATGTAVGVLAVENTDDELILARQALNDSSVPRGDRVFIFSPAAESGLLKLDRFVNNDYALIHGEGAAETGLQMAYMTSFYRIPIYISENVEGSNTAGHDNVLMHKEAFALVMQINPTMHAQFDIDYIVDKVVMEQLYGFKEMREDHAIFVRGA